MADATTTYLDATNGNAEVSLKDDAKTKWLLDNGYLTLPKPGKKDEDRGLTATSPPASADPTLAENREKPTPVDKFEPHLANGDDDPSENAETVHGRHMGLDAEPVGNPGPDVKVTTHKDAGKAV